MANNLREMFLSISEEIDLGDFNIEDVPELVLPENFNTEFHKKYLTRLAAKNDPETMSHYKGKYLSSADLKIKNGFIANGGTEEEWAKGFDDYLKLYEKHCPENLKEEKV